MGFSTGRSRRRAGSRGPREFRPTSIATAFDEAVASLRGREARNLPGNKTRLVAWYADGYPATIVAVSVRYQSTDVVTYNANGSIELQHGTHHTPTTKWRIMQYCPGVRVWISGHRLQIGRGGYHDPRPARPLINHVRLYADGTLVDPGEDYLAAVARDAAAQPAPEPTLRPRFNSNQLHLFAA